ncbi:heterokaryon incompatibility protein-domain-containing protein [Dactylonectria estremocensis]|uniref:Heterokaryon incompatibility protein-domain-containing protein n=1 Tax=Dactylonectria estremocensis TaxID=1079267 RepID=A0A9P9F4K2_9HYPO|nr:heterokaryon incompatibility protein-domain-containing protein [Dactylonectria estremocensis]
MLIGLRMGQQPFAHPANWAAAAAVILVFAFNKPMHGKVSRVFSSTWRTICLSRAIRIAFGFLYHDTIGDKQIRLIRLPDATSHYSPPRLTLHTFSLTECPHYLALSYTWGPPQAGSSAYADHDRTFIVLDGRQFAVRPNLFHALSQVSAARPGRYLWVDSICINQENPHERASQVGIMDHVYTSASETLIWLGPASQQSARAIELLKMMAVGVEAKILRWTSAQTFGDVFVADDAELLARNGLPPMTAEDWTDMADIYTRSWFGRVWMLQEVALSQNPTVLIGHHELPWDIIGHTSFVVILSNALVGLFAIGPGLQNINLAMGLVQASGLQVFREWSKGSQSPLQDALSNADFTAGITTHHASSLLLRLLLSSSGFQATFRRDRVYGLLAIANRLAQRQGLERLTLNVDYQSSDDDVLTSFGLDLFRQTNSLRLLSLAGLAGRSGESKMPTWIPSFENVHAPILGSTYNNTRPFNACNAQPSDIADFRIDGDDCKLHVKVVSPHIGAIEELGEMWPEILRGEFISCIKILLHCGPTYTFTQQPIVEAFWRTLIMDSDMSQRPAPAHLDQSFASWMIIITIAALCANMPSNPFIFDLFDSLEPLWVLANSRDTTNLLPKTSSMIPLLFKFGLRKDPSTPQISDSDRLILMSEWGKAAAPYEAHLRLTLLPRRRLARTVRGYLCLVPSSTNIGDKVMIVSGCPTPVVLRRVKTEEDCFTVVGDAYVHGAMFGEHITNDAVWRDVSLV